MAIQTILDLVSYSVETLFTFSSTSGEAGEMEFHFTLCFFEKLRKEDFLAVSRLAQDRVNYD